MSESSTSLRYMSDNCIMRNVLLRLSVKTDLQKALNSKNIFIQPTQQLNQCTHMEIMSGLSNF